MVIHRYLGTFSIIAGLMVGSHSFGMDELEALLQTMNENFRLSRSNKPISRSLTPQEEQEFQQRAENLNKNIEILDQTIEQGKSKNAWYSDEYQDYIKNHHLSCQEQCYFWNYIQNAQLWKQKPTFDELAHEFNRHKVLADAKKKPIDEITAMELIENLPTFNHDESIPNAKPIRSTKYLIIALTGISIPVAIGFGFGICKAMPYIRKKIKEWKAKTTSQVSVMITPASIATINQRPSLATIHQS